MTVTVEQLIDLLNEYEDETPVFISLSVAGNLLSEPICGLSFKRVSVNDGLGTLEIKGSSLRWDYGDKLSACQVGES